MFSAWNREKRVVRSKSSRPAKRGSPARRSRWASSLNVESLEGRQLLTAHPVGPQFLVSPTLALGDHSAPVAIINSAGDFVTAWRNLEANGSYSIDAEVVHADGTAASSVFQVTTGMLGNQLNPAIASDGNGDFVITWQGENLDQGGYDIYYKSESVAFDVGRAATVSGNDQNAALVSPADAAGTLDTINPTAAMDSSGNFVIAWQSQDASQPQNGYDIYARQGSDSGGLQAQDFLVNSTTDGDQTAPTAAMAQTTNSSFVIAWQGPSTAITAAAEEGDGESGEESGLGIFAKVYTSDGAVNSGEFQVDSGSNHDQVAPAVAMNADGQTVVAWQAEGNQGTGSDIFAREFTASFAGGAFDVTFGSQFGVNTTTQQPQRAPAVGIDQNGNLLVSWQSSHQDGYSWGVYGRYYQAGASPNSAAAATDELLINNQIQQGPQIAPAISVLPSGQAVITWLGPQVNDPGTEGQGGHPPGVHAKTLNINDLPTEITAGTVPSEFLVSLYTAPEDHPPAAAMDAQGNYVVVWQSWEDTGDMSGLGVFAQRYLADGTPIGGPVLVNSGTDPALTNGNQDSPSAAMDAAGDFVVVWHSQGLDGVQSSIMGRYFDAATQQWSDPFQVTPYSDNMPQKPAASMDSNGNFVVVWQSNNQEQVISGSAAKTANTFGIFGQRFLKGGSPEGASFQVNTFTDTNQVSPTVSMNAQGQFVVAWVSDHNVANDAGDTEKSIFARWYDANGQAANPEFLVNAYVKDAQESPSLAIGPNGDFVVVWQSINQEKNQLGAGSSWGVYARQFHPDGSSPQTQEFLVNQTTEGPQRYAGVGMSGQGNFTVAWQTMNQDGSSWAVMQRQFAANGSPMTDETQVNIWTSGPQILPAVAENARGNYDIFWAGQGVGSAGTPVDGIQGRLNAIPPAVLAIHGPTAINLMKNGVSGAYTLQLSATGDGADAVTSWTINWGDGDFQTVTGNPSSVSHAYKAIHQTYVITATADDASGSHAAGNTVSVTFDFDNQNERFVAALYQEFLHRDADPQGLSYHVNLLDSGASRESIALVFEGSREYSTSFVTGLYQSLLHRTASQSEIDFWVGRLIGGATWDQVESAFLGSAEYFAKHGSANAAFLIAVYEDVLGRSLDSTGQSFWEAKLASGMSRESVTAMILDSLETNQLLVEGWYQDYLHRPADESAGLPFWSGMLQKGTPNETVLAEILGSLEYYNLQ